MDSGSLTVAAARHVVDNHCSNPRSLPDGSVVRCNSRLRAVCPGCSNLAAGDWAAIIRSGIFDAPAGYRFSGLALTAPSFGATHHVVKVGRVPKRCACGARHEPERDAALRGLPLDLDAYDYMAAVEWNYYVGRLWNNLTRELRRLCPGLSYALVREWQARGSLHLHVLLRMPANEYLSPPVLEAMARRVTARVDGSVLRFGEQTKAAVLRADGTAAKAVWYVTKAVQYLVKDVADGGGASSEYGRAHWARLAAYAAAFRCPTCPASRSPYVRCSASCHRQWGATSRVITVADGRGRYASARPRWSFSGLTRTGQRRARSEWAAQNAKERPRGDRFAFAVAARRYLHARELDADPALAALSERLARTGGSAHPAMQ